MKTLKRSLAFVLALCMTLSLTAFAGYEDYSDADELTYVEAVDVLSELGIVEGSDGALLPTGNMTRAQAAKLIAYTMLGKKAANALEAETAPFADVPTYHWAAGYVDYCKDMDIVGDTGGSLFYPEENITASQLAKMLLCAVGYGEKGEFTGASSDSTVNAQAFKLGIFDGNEENVVFANVVTREEAWLYTFNALTKVMEINYNEETGEYYAGDISDPIRGFDFHETLGAKLYDLSKKAATDIFGREGHNWYKGATKIAGMYVDPAEAVYTAVVKSGTLFADLGLDVSTLATVYRNGEVQEDFLLEDGSKTKVGGKGILVEAYIDNNMNVTLIIVDTYLARITNVDTKYEEVILDVWMNGDGTTTESMAYMPTDLKVGDYALVTVVDGEVQTLARPEIINGILDARGVTTTYATLDGTKYSYAAHLDQNSEDVYHIEFDREMIMLLDEYGYMIGLMPVPAIDTIEGYVLVTDSELEIGGLASADKALVEVLHLDGSGYEVFSLNTKRIKDSDGTQVTQYQAPDRTWVTITQDENDFIPYGFYGYTMTYDGEIVLKALDLTESSDLQALRGSITATGTQMFTWSGEASNLVLDNDSVLNMVASDDIATLEGYKNIKVDETDVDILVVYKGRTVEEIYVVGDDLEMPARGMEYTINRMGMYDIDTHEEYKAIPKVQFLLEVDVTNECSSQIDTIMLVQYSADGQMLNMQYLYGKMNVGESYIFGTTIDNRDGRIGCIKAFVVPTVGNMVPLANTVEINGEIEEEEKLDGYVLVTDSELRVGGLVANDKALVEILYLDGTGYEVLNLETRRTGSGTNRVTQYLAPDGTWVDITQDKGNFIPYGFYGYTLTEDDEIVLMDLSATTANEFQTLGGAITAKGTQALTVTDMPVDLLLDNESVLNMVTPKDCETFEGYKNIKIDEINVDALVVYSGRTVEEIFVVDGTIPRPNPMIGRLISIETEATNTAVIKVTGDLSENVIVKVYALVNDKLGYAGDVSWIGEEDGVYTYKYENNLNADYVFIFEVFVGNKCTARSHGVLLKQDPSDDETEPSNIYMTRTNPEIGSFALELEGSKETDNVAVLISKEEESAYLQHRLITLDWNGTLHKGTASMFCAGNYLIQYLVNGKPVSADTVTLLTGRQGIETEVDLWHTSVQLTATYDYCNMTDVDSLDMMVYYRKAGSTDWKGRSVSGHLLYGTKTVTLSGLSPNTEYEFEIEVELYSGSDYVDYKSYAGSFTTIEAPENAISTITVSSLNTDSVSAFGIEKVDDGEFVAEIEDYITMNSDDILEIKVNTYDSDATIWIESDEDSDYGSDNEWMEIEISTSEWDDGVVVLYIIVEESDGCETFYTLYIYID